MLDEIVDDMNSNRLKGYTQVHVCSCTGDSENPEFSDILKMCLKEQEHLTEMPRRPLEHEAVSGSKSLYHCMDALNVELERPSQT